MKVSHLLIMVLVLSLAFGVGVYWGEAGIWEQMGEMWQTEEQPTTPPEKIDAEPVKPEIDENFLGALRDVLWQKYLRPQEMDAQDLTLGAASGLVRGLGDPYSEFFSPEEAGDFFMAVDGELSGIGAEIGRDEEGTIIVAAPLPDSPAERAGLQPRDKILAIDDESTVGMDLHDAVELIRGIEGTQVKLLILHEGAGQVEEVELTRERIHLDSLVADLTSEGILDVVLVQFDEDTPREFVQQIEQLTASGASVKAVLLDLRGNTGGYFEGAIAVAGEFLEAGEPVVIEKGRADEVKRVARGLSRLSGVPTVVLVDGATASAAEILAGALQDLPNVTLIGTTTFGKGTVQEIISLPDGSALKVTVSEWLLPDGSPVNEIGIEPDVTIEFEEGDWETGYDRQREEALRILRDRIKN